MGGITSAPPVDTSATSDTEMDDAYQQIIDSIGGFLALDVVMDSMNKLEEQRQENQN